MRNKVLLCAAVAAATVMSCNKNDIIQAPAVEEGVIHFSVKSNEAEAATKALTAYTDSQDYETATNSIQIFVFDGDGELNGYKNLVSATSGDISTTVGEKTVWAVVNGPQMTDISTESELKSKALDLADNSKSGGFVMSGFNSCTVAGSGADCEITVSRLVSRVALVSVVNNLPEALGTFRIENVFLSNVVGNQNIEGSASASTWYNKEGREDEETRNGTHIIDGGDYEAYCPELTFNGTATDISNGSIYQPSTPILFYSYPNSATAKGNGFSNPFTAQRGVLVVSATVNDALYYYPVVLDNSLLERNKTYTVGITVTGFGSDDPNVEVDKGALEFSIEVSDWVAGATYEEVI